MRRRLWLAVLLCAAAASAQVGALLWSDEFTDLDDEPISLD